MTAQLGVWRKHLPPLFQKLARIQDLRRPGSVRHKATVILLYGLLLFVFHYASRREANWEATSPVMAEALRHVFPDVDSVPHFDTVERLLRTIPVETWETVLGERIATLLRQHQVQQYLVHGHWVVAIDGTQKFARYRPFAPEALRRQVSETETLYCVSVLEAVLVAADGLPLPLTTEFCENTAGPPPQTETRQRTQSLSSVDDPAQSVVPASLVVASPGRSVPQRPRDGALPAVSLGLFHCVAGRVSPECLGGREQY